MSDSTAFAEQEVDVRRLLNGDETEFEKMVLRESPRLFRMIVRIVKDEDEAESIMQEAYLQAFKGLHTFRGESKFTTWLYAIAINLARAALRAMRRTTTFDEDDVERMQPGFVNGTHIETYGSWNPLRVAELGQQKEIVHRAIDRLPSDYRTIVVLRDIEELSTAEAAAILNITEGAARVRLHRARQALRSTLDAYFT